MTTGVVAVFQTRIEAEIARARLEALGIPAWIDADDAGGLYPQFQFRGVRLVVDADDKEAAQRILAQPGPENEDVRGDLEAAERVVRAPPMRSLGPGRLTIGSALVALLALALLGLILRRLLA